MQQLTTVSGVSRGGTLGPKGFFLPPTLAGWMVTVTTAHSAGLPWPPIGAGEPPGLAAILS